jgi:dihydroorotate dehydrogenase (fumarate)
MDDKSINKKQNEKYFIGNIEFDNPFLNASGCWVMNKDQMMELNESKLGGVISKTCTIFSKIGNDEPNYFYDGVNNIHFNCKGLPNYGYNYYRNVSNNITSPFFLSIAYDKTENLTTILNDYGEYINNNNGLIEINMSCPNIENRISGYHLDDIESICTNLCFQKVSQKNINKLMFGLKLPPYFEIEFIYKLALILNKYSDAIKFITMSNTVPITLPIYDNEFVLSNKYGGLSGKINKYIAMGNIFTIKKKLINDIKIIGCGGIETLQDIKDYKKVGADFFQLGSCFYDEISNKLDVEKINKLIDAFKIEK